MPKFCAFTRHRNNAALIVNRDLVRAVSHDPSVGGTVILFDAAHTLVVAESLETVVAKMNAK